MTPLDELADSSGSWEELGILLAKGVGIPLLVEQVGIDLGSVPQVLAVNVAQQQRRKALREGFRATPWWNRWMTVASSDY